MEDNEEQYKITLVPENISRRSAELAERIIKLLKGAAPVYWKFYLTRICWL